MPSSTGHSEPSDQDSTEEPPSEAPQNGPNETACERTLAHDRIAGRGRRDRGAVTRHSGDRPAVALKVEVALLDMERAALEKQVATLESDVDALQEEVATLEDTLAYTEQRLQGAIDRYERILDRRGGEGKAAGGDPEPASSRGSLSSRSVREFVGGVVSRLR